MYTLYSPRLKKMIPLLCFVEIWCNICFMISSINQHMKIAVFLLTIFISTVSWAQFDNPSNETVKFEQIEEVVPDNTALNIPATSVPGLIVDKPKYELKNDRGLGEEDPKPIGINTDDGFLTVKTDMTPKSFLKDKEATDEYDRDQALGQLSTKGSYVNVVYRDHQSVDGDRIRVYVNDDIVQSDISLDSSFKGFNLNLVPGRNAIDFQALNQGDSGPNTAELHVYDDKGILISKNEWNLLTGRKATILVIKE